MAGYVGNVQSPEYIQSLPSFSIPYLNNATHRLFEVEGHSMQPTLHATDIVAGRYVERLDQIMDDRIHIVVTEDSVLVKRLLYMPKEEKVICKSDNADQGYPSILLDFNEVKEICYVVMNLTRQLPPPRDIYKRVSDVEAQVLMWGHKLKQIQEGKR